MLSFFRTNQLISSALLIFYILLLWSSAWLLPVADWKPTGAGIFSHMLYAQTGLATNIAKIIAIVLLWIQAFMINALVARFRISIVSSQLPGLFFLFFSACISDTLHLSPPLIGNTFILISLFNLFNTFKKPTCAALIFNTGLWFGVGSLFYYGLIPMFLAMIIGLSVLRSFRLNEYLVLITGFIVPYILAAVWFFWNDQLGDFWQIQIIQNFGFLNFRESGNWLLYIKLIFYGLVLIFVIFNVGSYLFKQNIATQKYITILYWILLTAGLVLLMQNQVTLDTLLLLAIPLGIFIAYTFNDMSNMVAELCHLMLLFAVLLFQYVKL